MAISYTVEYIRHLCGITEFLYVSNRRLAFSPDLLFCEFWLRLLILLKWRLLYDSNDECIILEDMQYYQPHMNLYRENIFLSWRGRIDRSVESPMMILLSTYIECLVPNSSGGPTMLLWSSRTYNCSNNFKTNCGSEGPSIYNLMQSLEIGDCTTLGYCITQL